jgi:cytochrome c-type biogenesis protein CcmH
MLVAAMLVLHAPPLGAVQPDEILSDPALEQRARNLSRELRCMVCQNQSIDDSDAPLARDLRLLVRERLQAGDSDRQVMAFLTDRYGEFVLLNPPVNARTILLWLLPASLLLIGAGVLVSVMRRRRPGASDDSAPQAVPLTADEQARVGRLLEQDPQVRR